MTTTPMDKSRKCSTRNTLHYIKYLIIFPILVLLLIPPFGYLIIYDFQWAYLAFLAVGLFSLYKLIDVIAKVKNPANGKLGKSALFYSDGTVTQNVDYMFKMIDNDMTIKCKKFGKVCVGDKWIVGDEAMPIDRVRGIFGQAIVIRSATSRTRNYSILLVDDKKNIRTLTVIRESQLDKLYDYLHKIIPNAGSGGAEDCAEFIAVSDDEWANFNRDFEQKRQANAN